MSDHGHSHGHQGHHDHVQGPEGHSHGHAHQCGGHGHEHEHKSHAHVDHGHAHHEHHHGPTPLPHKEHKEGEHGHGHSHGHSHGGAEEEEHSHGHGHSHGGKWKPDFEAWDGNEDIRQMSRSVIGIMTAQDWWSNSFVGLDFGCGTGYLSRKIVADGRAASFVAADVEQGFLNVVERKVQEENVGDKVSLLFLSKEDGSDVVGKGPFDVVVSVFVFGHIRDGDVPSVMSNVSSAIKPGGHFVITEFDQSKTKLFGDSKEHISDGGHAHTIYTPERFKAMFEGCGMALDNVIVHEADINWHGEMKHVFANVYIGKKL